MPIPSYETLMLPVLKLFSSGARNVADCLPELKQQFHITDEEAEELPPRSDPGSGIISIEN